MSAGERVDGDFSDCGDAPIGAGAGAVVEVVAGAWGDVVVGGAGGGAGG